MKIAWILLFYLVLSGCAKAAGPELSVEMSEDGSCYVRGVEVTCLDVPTYLKDTAMIPFDTYIAVTVSSENASYQSLQHLVERLRAVGYTSVIGSIELQPNKTMEPTR